MAAASAVSLLAQVVISCLIQTAGFLDSFKDVRSLALQPCTSLLNRLWLQPCQNPVSSGLVTTLHPLLVQILEMTLPFIGNSHCLSPLKRESTPEFPWIWSPFDSWTLSVNWAESRTFTIRLSHSSPLCSHIPRDKCRCLEYPNHLPRDGLFLAVGTRSYGVWWPRWQSRPAVIGETLVLIDFSQQIDKEQLVHVQAGN